MLSLCHLAEFSQQPCEVRRDAQPPNLPTPISQREKLGLGSLNIYGPRLLPVIEKTFLAPNHMLVRRHHTALCSAIQQTFSKCPWWAKQQTRWIQERLRHSPQPQEALESSKQQTSKQWHHTGGHAGGAPNPALRYQGRLLGRDNIKAGTLKWQGKRDPREKVQHLQRPWGQRDSGRCGEVGSVSAWREHGLPGEDGLGWQSRQGRALKPSGATLRLCPLPSEKQEVDEDSHKEMTHSASHFTKIKLAVA